MAVTALSQTPEAGFVALAMLYPEVTAQIGDVPLDVFDSAPCRAIAECIRDLVSEGRAVSLITVNEELARRGSLRAIGGTAFLSEITSTLPFLRHESPHLIASLRRSYTTRRLRQLGSRLAKLPDDSDLESTLGMLDREVDDVRNAISAEMPTLLSEIVGERIETAYGKGDGGKPHIGWGEERLDKVFNGFRPGEMTVLAARTSMGKTHFALHATKMCAFRSTLPSVFYSLEMSEESVADRIFASESRIDSNRLKDVAVWDTEGKSIRAQSAKKLIDSSPIFVSSRHRSTLEIRSASSRLKHRYGLGLICIDYLELISDTDGENEVDRLGRISRSVRAMSADLEVPVLLVHQVNRQPDYRSEKRPSLSDLRGSGHVENAADSVIFLFRPGYYGDETHGPGYTEVIVAKQRNGRTGMVPVYLDLATGVVSSVDAFHEFREEARRL